MLRSMLPRIYVIMLRRIEDILCRITKLSYVVMLRRIVILRRICSKVCDVE